jgi:hypothetical protein
MQTIFVSNRGDDINFGLTKLTPIRSWKREPSEAFRPSGRFAELRDLDGRDVGFWHLADISADAEQVRFRGQSGHP